MYYITVTSRKDGMALADAVLTFERDGEPLFCVWSDEDGRVKMPEELGID